MNMEGDFTHKRCMRDNERYADLINGIAFCGEQVIKPENLTEMGEQVGIDKSVNRRYRRKKEKERDIVKKVSFGVNFMVLGLEGQSGTNYLMALRNLSYEVMEYERQAAIQRKKVRSAKGISKEEYVSGFRKKDKLHPCVMFVMYYGKEPWDGSLELHEILDMQDIPEGLRKYINNYRVHIIDVRRMENTDVFRTDLKQIFDFLRYSEDREKLQELVEKDETYRNMDEDAYDLLAEYSDSEELLLMKKYQGEDGKVDMCKGLKDWAAEERAAGKAEGKAEGCMLTLFRLIEKGSLTIEEGAEEMGCAVSELEKLLMEKGYKTHNLC